MSRTPSLQSRSLAERSRRMKQYLASDRRQATGSGAAHSVLHRREKSRIPLYRSPEVGRVPGRGLQKDTAIELDGFSGAARRGGGRS